VAGSVDAATVFAAGAEAFDCWARGSSPAENAASARQEKPQALFVEDSDSQVHLQVAFRGFARPDRRIMATRLLRRILCGGGCSRLHLLLREELGIIYSVDASISAYEETGSFAIELSTAPENLCRAVAEVLRETLRLAAEPVGEKELQRIKQGYFFDLEYSRDSTYEMQVRYGWGELMGLVRHIDEDRAEAEAIDAEILRSTARELFAPRNLNLVAVGPWQAPARKEVEKLLAKYEKEWQQQIEG
jgi:predicted Zn-dependent peptidase